MKSFDFAELSCRSCFSFLSGASQPEELVRTAKHYGYRALALTDQNGFYGMVRGYIKAKELNFLFHAGTEIEVNGTKLIILPQQKKGYQKLCRLLSEGFQSQEKGKINITKKLLETFLSKEDHFVLLPPRDFPRPSFLCWLQERFDLTQLVTKTYHPDRDRRLKKWLSQLDKSIPYAWTFDARYHHPSRAELFEVMEAIDQNTSLKEKLPSPNRETFLKPLSFFSSHQVPQKWLRRTIEISEACRFSPDEIRYTYPQEWLPTGKTSTEFLRELCEEGAKKRYHSNLPEAHRRQLEHELRLIRELHYEDYFLTIWDIVQFARSQNILCQGRGSAANSIVCYLLEITSIDPIQLNLLFERFISKERGEAPDIDVDFEHERREEVIQYVYQKYGRHRAGMVATLITYRSRSALRDCGKALDMDPKKIDLISKKTRWRENTLEELSKSSSPKEKRWAKVASELKGMPRHLGQHTGGMILTQDRLDEISPIEPASMKDRSVVQWDKYDVEQLGLLKVDILGLGMLTCIRKSLELLKKHHDRSLELYQIPMDDKKTYKMIQEARTVGVFQIESRAQMSMLPRLKPRCFYDLVIEVAIVRPGPIQGGMIHPYLKRRMGLEEVTYAHPKLRPILQKTLGVPIFQEQVMKMAIEVAGYRPGEADALRRAMGAWRKTGNLQPHADELKKRLIQNGVPEEFSQRVCQQILGFGEYGFPESHAASFALLTYASCYLKAHYPAIFLCGLLNSMPMGFYSFHALTANAQREGVKILGVDLKKSYWDHTVERIDGEDHLRLGFRCVKNLNEERLKAFVKKREETQKTDLSLLHLEERSSLALAASSFEKRRNYWQSLDPFHSKRLNPMGLHSQKAQRFPHLSETEAMLLDFEFTGTTLDKHPASLLKEKSWPYPVPREQLTYSHQIQNCPKKWVFVFGMVQVIQSPPTAKGMVFITLEDEYGFYNLALQPPTFKKYKDIVQNQFTLLVSGQLQNKDGAWSILVKQVYSPQANPEQPRDLKSKTRFSEQGHPSAHYPQPRLFNGI